MQEIVAEKRDKFLNNALARFERRQAQRSERKDEVIEGKKSQKRQKVEKSVTIVEDYGGQKTEQGEFNVDSPLKQMVVEEEEVQVKQETRAAAPPSSISQHSKTITRAPPASLLRRPGVGPQPPVPTLLSGSRMLK